MKHKVKLFRILILCFFINQVVKAQELVEDQNPNFAVSISKYLRLKDSLPNTMGVSVQDTYKAYDWYEARLERRAQRRENRYRIRLARALYGSDCYYSNYIGSGLYDGFGYRGIEWGLRPSIDFRTGNWIFSF